MIRFYRLDTKSLLDTPKKHFFWLLRMLPRVRAEENLVLLQVFAAAQSDKDGFMAIYDGLDQEVGVVYHHRPQPAEPKTIVVEDENALDPEFDRAGLRALKAKHGA